MDVDDDGFKIYTASRLNKARGLTKGRAAPCTKLITTLNYIITAYIVIFMNTSTLTRNSIFVKFTSGNYFYI